MPTFRHVAALLAFALVASVLPAAPAGAETTLAPDHTVIYDSPSQALSACGGVTNVGAALAASSVARPYLKIPAGITTGPAIFSWAYDHSRVSTSILGYVCIPNARANGWSEGGNAADAAAQLQKYGRSTGSDPQSDPRYGIWHTASASVAASTCGQYRDPSLIMLDLHAANANGSIKPYVIATPIVQRLVVPGQFELSCRALAANGWNLVTTIPEWVGVNTPSLDEAKRECSVKDSMRTASGASWGTVVSFASEASANKTYFVYNPTGADPSFDAKRAGFTCLGDVPTVAKTQAVTLAAFNAIVAADFAAAHPHAAPTPAPWPTHAPAVWATHAPVVATAPVVSCGPIGSWPVHAIDTSGFKIADDDACAYYVVAPVNVRRNGDNTLTFFGHTVRHGTLNFPGTGYYFRVPATGVSAQALASGRIDAVQVRGAGYVDASLLHRTDSSDFFALLPVNGAPILVPAGVINAGAYNLIPPGNPVIAAGAGNVINAGAHNFSQAMQSAGVIAAGAFN